MRAGYRLALALAPVAAAAIAAACHDNVGVGACFEPNATRYDFFVEGADSTFVFRWPGGYMPVRVYAEQVGDLPANVAAGMELWRSAFRCGELGYTLAADSTHADIIVRNPASLPVLSRRAVAVFADSVHACGGVTEFDTLAGRLAGPMRAYVAPRSVDTAAVSSCYHFVVAHELGHTLGLGSHSRDTNDLMNPLPRRLALSERDRYTIQVLYHTDPTIGPPPR